MTAGRTGSTRRNSIRSRRSRRPDRARRLSGTAGPEAAHRPPQCPRNRDGGLPLLGGAGEPRHHRGRPRPNRRLLRRRRCRRTSATGSRRSSSCSARSAARKNLADVSAVDFSKSAERDVDAFCRQGFGALIAKLGQGVPVQLSNPVKAIDLSGRAYVEIRTTRGTITARAVIVTASTGVLLDNRIRFEPELPRRYTDALAASHARQLRPHRARAAGQSARSGARRGGVREIGLRAHRRDPRQRVGHHAVHWSRSAASSAASSPRKASRRWSSSRSTGSPASTAPR